MVAQSKAGRTSVACQGCFLSCQSNRLGNVHRQIPKLTLSSPIGFSGRRLRQGPSDQWEAVIESLPLPFLNISSSHALAFFTPPLAPFGLSVPVSTRPFLLLQRVI